MRPLGPLLSLLPGLTRANPAPLPNPAPAPTPAPAPAPASPFIPVFHDAILAPAAQANSFAVVGETGVSAQQLWYDKGFVWIVDKTENNSLQVGGHPAWSAVYNLADNTVRALDVVTNTFCAGGCSDRLRYN